MSRSVQRGFVFVTGGARSGKSTFALRFAEAMEGSKVYLATATPLDSEMEERIKRHRDARGKIWSTVEEPRDVVGVIEQRKDSGVILLDCITMWIANLLEEGFDDEEILEEVERFVDLCARADACVVVVSNELGMGIVPENPVARRFRDLCGTINQRIAGRADEVYFVVSGMSLRIK